MSSILMNNKKMPSILYIGDFIKQNGPSVFDSHITKYIYGVKKEQIDRKITLLFIKELINSDVVHVSGISGKGLFSLLLAKVFFKKTSLTMHSSLKKEKEFRKIKQYRIYMEYLQMMLSNKIICVSEMLSDLVKRLYRRIDSQKICCIHNGIDMINLPDEEKKKDKYSLITTGGGRKEKGVLYVCKAIEKLNMKGITLFVVGEDGVDTKKIKDYKFVKYLGLLFREEFLEILKKSNIFIQNSVFDSFGLSVIEAASYKCKVILSNNIGALEVLKLESKYIINYNDIHSIGQIISELIFDGRQKIILNLDSWAGVAEKYKRLWCKLTT